MLSKPFIIDDDNYREHLADTEFDGHRGFGLVPRTSDPDPDVIVPMHAVQMEMIPETEWVDRIRERQAKQNRNVDRWRQGNNGQPIPFVIQGQWGYCWGHGPINAQSMMRANMNLPYRALSAFSVCSPIKNGANEGAWGALALEFMLKNGACTQDLWPQGQVRLPETADVKASRAANKLTGTWMDMASPVYNRDLSKAQIVTLLLNDIPVVGDFMWWGHCVALLDPVIVTGNQIDTICVNSWAGWGGYFQKGDGLAVLSGSKAFPDNAVAPKTLVAA